MKAKLWVLPLLFVTSCVCANGQHNHRTTTINHEIRRINMQMRKLQREVKQLKVELKQHRQSDSHKQSNMYRVYGHAHGPTVTTSPYYGLRSAFDASDLIVNLPTMNEDLRLLKQRVHYEKAAKGIHPPYANHPVLVLSGKIEAQTMLRWPYAGPTSSDVNLSTAELETLVNAGPWALGVVSIQYDDSLPDPALSGAGQRIANSRIFLRRGFITIGNLNRFPLYFSSGQMFVPFGRYASSMVSTPLTQQLGRVNARDVLLGFYHDGIYAEVYAFKGDSHTGTSGINQGGGNLGYETQRGTFSFNGGAGVIANMSDADGMQKTGAAAGSFQGFGDASGLEKINRRVPGLNIHTEISYGPVNFIAAYVSALRPFAFNDLNFNNGGARPQALHLEAGYHFHIFWHRPASINAAFGHSWQALALDMPESSYTAIFNTSLWKNTILAIEFRHDVNYPRSDTAGGRCIAGDGTVFLCTASPMGRRNQDTLLAQLGLYF